MVNETMSLFSWIGSGLLGLGAWALMYTGLPAEPAAILAALMAVDFIVGIGKARAVGEPVTSLRMKNGAMSKCGVMLVPLVLALAAKGVGADLQWIVSWTVSLFILSEAYSVIANIYTIRTKQAVPEWDAMSAVLRKVRGLLERMEERQ